MKATPPGTAYGQGHKSRFSVIFWQDSNNYLLFRYYVDDNQTNAAEIEMTSFVQGTGAVQRFINMTTDIFPGVQRTIRASFNGDDFVCWLDGEPVLLGRHTDVNASFTPLTINAIGIGVGTQDTGTVARDFIARSSTAP